MSVGANKVGCELQIFQDCSTWAGARVTKVLPLPCPWGLLFAGRSDSGIALPRDVGVVSPDVCQAVTVRVSHRAQPHHPHSAGLGVRRTGWCHLAHHVSGVEKASGSKGGVFI